MEYRLLPLEKYHNTTKDLFFWIKHFYVHKISTLDHSKAGDDFDLAGLVQDMLKESTNTIEKVSEVAKRASRDIKSLKQYYPKIELLYKYVESQKLASIKEVDQPFIEEFILKVNHDKSQSQKEGLYTYSKALFNFIQEYNTVEGQKEPFMFNIGKDIDGNAKPLFRGRRAKKLPVFLETKEMMKLDKSIFKYPYKDEFDRARQILIIRLFMFGLVTTSELMKIKDSDFVEVEDKDVLELKVGKRVVPLPRRLFIRHLNTYRKLDQCKESEYFFCSQRTQTPINNQAISKIVKSQLGFAKIKKKELTAEALRNSGTIYLSRQGVGDKKLQAYTGHSTMQGLRKVLDAGNTDHYTTAQLLSDFVNNE